MAHGGHVDQHCLTADNFPRTRRSDIVPVEVEAQQVSRRIYELLVRTGGQPAPSVQSWTGELWGDPDAPATIVLKGPGALRSMLLPPNDLSAGEAYVFDDVDFDGDVFAVVSFGARLAGSGTSLVTKLRLLRLLRQLPATAQRNPATRPRFSGLRHHHKPFDL